MSGTNCEVDGASLLDKLYSFFKPSNASSTSPSKSHDSEAIGRVSDIVHIGKEVQCGVSAAVRACDVKLFLVAYVSGFIVKCLFNNNRCDIRKKCLVSEVPSPLDFYTGFKEQNSTVQSLTYPTEKLVAHLDSVELHVTDAINKGADFDRMSAGCSPHYQGIVDGIVRGVTRISIPWWCKKQNQLRKETARQKAFQRKTKILLHQ
jgi:hypothetical protein